MRPLIYYCTAHGYGHAVRTCDILRAFHAAYPVVPIHLVTELPEPFLRNRLPTIPFTLRRAGFDVGMVQKDSVRVDVAKTLDAAIDLVRRRNPLRVEEAAYLKKMNAGLLVSDIPSIPLEAAADAGVPRIAVGNFSWNWIYGAFVDRDPRWRDVVAMYEEGYAAADLLLRLPFAEPMTAFSNHVDLPVVADAGTPSRDQLAELTGAPKNRRWVLLSFSTLDWSGEAVDRVTSMNDTCFFTVLPLQWQGRNLHAVDRNELSFSDVLASVDVVVTKPGFGIVSECVVNRKPIVYVDREDFREYPILEQSIHRYLRHAHISAADLYAGRLREALTDVERATKATGVIASGGARVAADHMAARLAR